MSVLASRIPHILIVDDSEEDIEILTMQLKANGVEFTIQTCSDADIGSRTVSAFTSSSTLPKLIVLDLHIPPTDGHAVFVEVRKNPVLGKVPVLIMTTSASPNDLDQFRSQPYTHVVTKPFSLKEYAPVIQMIRHLLADAAL